MCLPKRASLQYDVGLPAPAANAAEEVAGRKQ